MFDPEIMGIAVGIVFLSSVEAEIHIAGSFSIPLSTQFVKTQPSSAYVHVHSYMTVGKVLGSTPGPTGYQFILRRAL